MHWPHGRLRQEGNTRPAVWPDRYYLPTSSGDDLIQKHACVADRASMLAGKPGTEQCVIIDGVNFLNYADIDRQVLPAHGAPNIMMAAGGTQLKNVVEDEAIHAWKFHVDWETPANTAIRVRSVLRSRLTTTFAMDN